MLIHLSVCRSIFTTFYIHYRKLKIAEYVLEVIVAYASTVWAKSLTWTYRNRWYYSSQAPLYQFPVAGQGQMAHRTIRSKTKHAVVDGSCIMWSAWVSIRSNQYRQIVLEVYATMVMFSVHITVKRCVIPIIITIVRTLNAMPCDEVRALAKGFPTSRFSK